MNRITEGVGKKIVDALKLQSENVVVEAEENISENFENDNEWENSQPEVVSPIISEPQTDELDDIDIPANIVVLKKLITQLPAGVSRQTGAQIIKQTMEALGISMKSVLQEAQQVQENLNNSSKECQNSIAEYKKQIGVLEKQSQKYQRQYSAINDIISLFIQTNF